MRPFLSVDLFKSFSTGRSIRARFDVLSERIGRPLVLMGESGCGKSTLFRMIAGLDAPDTGSIRCGDSLWFESRTGSNVVAEVRRVGYLPQEDLLFPHMSVRKNLRFVLEVREGSGWRCWFGQKNSVERLVDAAIDRFGLSGFCEERPCHLSGGQKRRVSVARLSLCAPSLLLLDEPLRGLDSKARHEIRTILLEFVAENAVPALWITHDSSDLEALGGLFGHFVEDEEGGGFCLDIDPSPHSLPYQRPSFSESGAEKATGFSINLT